MEECIETVVASCRSTDKFMIIVIDGFHNLISRIDLNKQQRMDND